MSLGNYTHTQGLKKHFTDKQLFRSGARDNLGIKISLNLYPFCVTHIPPPSMGPLRMIVGTFPLPIKPQRTTDL